MQTELTWQMWLRNHKNRALLESKPHLAKKKFLVEQDEFRRKWDYLGNMWLSSTALTTKEDEIESDFRELGKTAGLYGVDNMVIYNGSQTTYTDDNTGEILIETAADVFEPIFIVR